MIKLKLPHINLYKFVRPMIGLILLSAFGYVGYLAQQIQAVQADQAHLESEQQKLQQQKLRFDRETLEEITAPPREASTGRNPFSP